MDFVIDAQGFVNPDGVFLPKEICVLSLMHHAGSNWIIAPPHPYNHNIREVKKCIDHATLRVHGLQWSDGDVLAEDLYKTIKTMLSTANRIYAYRDSSPKIKFLEQLMNRKVYNLTDYFCPEPQILSRTFKFKFNCLTHMLKNKNRSQIYRQCSFNRCHLMKKWILGLAHEFTGLPVAVNSETIFQALEFNVERNIADDTTTDGNEDVDDDDEDDDDDDDDDVEVDIEEGNPQDVHRENNANRVASTPMNSPPPPAYYTLFPPRKVKRNLLPSFTQRGRASDLFSDLFDSSSDSEAASYASVCARK
uniref:DDE-1 domain-containing protein n=1 Tax=Trichogramma kaykai TaxID=54128 RepID=A0ABD2VUE5_9HYME